MAANVTPKLWELADMVKVLEDWETTEIESWSDPTQIISSAAGSSEAQTALRETGRLKRVLAHYSSEDRGQPIDQSRK